MLTATAQVGNCHLSCKGKDSHAQPYLEEGNFPGLVVFQWLFRISSSNPCFQSSYSDCLVQNHSSLSSPLPTPPIFSLLHYKV